VRVLATRSSSTDRSPELPTIVRAGPPSCFRTLRFAASMRGRRLAAKLVRAALDDVRDTNQSVIPRCWFVAQFIHDHPEYHDLHSA